MLLENGKLVGGYTIRVMRDQASPEERKEIDAAMGFVID